MPRKDNPKKASVKVNDLQNKKDPKGGATTSTTTTTVSTGWDVKTNKSV